MDGRAGEEDDRRRGHHDLADAGAAGEKDVVERQLEQRLGDIDAAYAHLVERGVDVSPIRHVDQVQGGWADGKGGPYNSFIFFKDPDGNGWAIQESPLLGGEGSGS